MRIWRAGASPDVIREEFGYSREELAGRLRCALDEETSAKEAGRPIHDDPIPGTKVFE
jgi:hypothetical protein